MIIAIPHNYTCSILCLFLFSLISNLTSTYFLLLEPRERLQVWGGEVSEQWLLSNVAPRASGGP